MDRYDLCRALARDAGKLAHRAFGTSAVSMKGRHDVVTEMDREVERFIRAAIARRFPDDAIIGEEDGGASGDRLWLIDPIDGTANYAHGLPRYCVSIGNLEHGVPTLGAIYDRSHDWLYAAAKGDGAWFDGQRMSVSSGPEAGPAGSQGERGKWLLFRLSAPLKRSRTDVMLPQHRPIVSYRHTVPAASMDILKLPNASAPRRSRLMACEKWSARWSERRRSTPQPPLLVVTRSRRPKPAEPPLHA